MATRNAKVETWNGKNKREMIERFESLITYVTKIYAAQKHDKTGVV